MKDCGLGTLATRVATIETLIGREYVLCEGKSLKATDKAIRLIDTVHPTVKSPTCRRSLLLKRTQRSA